MTDPFQTYIIDPSTLYSTLKFHNILPNDETSNTSSSSPSSSSSRIILLSSPWFLPTSSPFYTPHQSFLSSHIPNSLLFDIDLICDPSSPYPHMLPSAPDFAKHMTRLNIRPYDTMVIYDAAETGLFSAPRVAWMFRYFDHKGGVHVLDNYHEWTRRKYPTTESEAQHVQEAREGKYEVSTPNRDMLVDFDEMKGLVNLAKGDANEREVVRLDARPKGRFLGKDPEPRKGLESGHMPRSISLPFIDVLDSETKMLKSEKDLKKIFSDKGVDGSKEVILTCGSGVSASVLDAAIIKAGLVNKQQRIYDGSWTEWVMRAGDDDGMIMKE